MNKEKLATKKQVAYAKALMHTCKADIPTLRKRKIEFTEEQIKQYIAELEERVKPIREISGRFAELLNAAYRYSQREVENGYRSKFDGPGDADAYGVLTIYLQHREHCYNMYYIEQKTIKGYSLSFRSGKYGKTPHFDIYTSGGKEHSKLEMMLKYMQANGYGGRMQYRTIG